MATRVVDDVAPSLPPLPGRRPGPVPIPRPLLRGWSHALAVPAAIAATVVLASRTRGDSARQASLLVYGIASVVLFAGSAAYHLLGTTPRRRAVLRRVDHSNIFLLVAATCTPIAVAHLTATWRSAFLLTVWALAAIGIGAVAVPGWNLPHGLRAACYVGQGLIGIAALPPLIGAVGWSGVAVLLTAGLLYCVGALTYSFRRPRLWPRVFGYHEVFHLLVIAANTLFFVFMLRRIVRA